MPLLTLLLALLVSLITSVALGYALLRLVRLPIDSAVARVPVAGTLGLAFISSLTVLVGVAFGWDPGIWIVLALSLLTAGLGVFPAWRDGRLLATGLGNWWRETNLLERVVVIVGAVGMLGRINFAGLPSALTDDIRSYLRGPQLLVLEGRLVSLPDDIFSYWPMDRQMFSVIGFFLWDFRLALLFGFMVSLLLFGCVIALTHRLVNRRAALLSIPVLIYLPVIMVLTPSGKTDILFALFMGAAFLVMEFLPSARSRNALALIIGVFFGAAFGTKISAPLLLPVLAIWAVRLWIITPRKSRPAISALVLHLGIAALGAFLIHIPWLVKDWLEFGTPFNLVHRMSRPSTFEGSYAQVPFSVLLKRMLELVRSPYLLTTVVPILFWLLMVIGLIRHRKENLPWWILGAGFAGFPLVYALAPKFFSARYVLPSFVLFSVLAAAGFAAVIEHRQKWIRWGVAGVFSLLIAATVIRGDVLGYRSVKVLLGIEPLETYVNRYIGPHEVIAWSRRHWTWDDKVWSVNVTDLMYFNARVYYIASSLPGLDLRYMSSAEERCRYMDSVGIGHVLIGPPLSRQGHPEEWDELVNTCLDTEFVSSDSAYVVYRRRGPGEP